MYLTKMEEPRESGARRQSPLLLCTTKVLLQGCDAKVHQCKANQISEIKISAKTKHPKMKKRTKITLTIVGLLALTGIFCAANPTPFTPATCQFSTSSSNNFNNFSINAGNYLWF